MTDGEVSPDRGSCCRLFFQVPFELGASCLLFSFVCGPLVGIIGTLGIAIGGTVFMFSSLGGSLTFSIPFRCFGGGLQTQLYIRPQWVVGRLGIDRVGIGWPPGDHREFARQVGTREPGILVLWFCNLSIRMAAPLGISGGVLLGGAGCGPWGRGARLLWRLSPVQWSALRLVGNATLLCKKN